ncbi:signal peptide peptidase SppA [Entomospira culicis]|uniref:Signal peptide peptidase SppA n=1 Tax=Entomospira culicis TaxID=2719989 RepID=A0A968GL23_9SPIO|nr:signal peptide peptidase SppA [Entomospira culicis]NIZ19320.1 signal peptide peptidase SppA [Entomospira culicis]NIZ69775.1 signal peptide peptidase SppA [Entomospira culicis]WDI36886.1 signal peptide peptidase SppA [Entomospira culicis]WDI38515.1 signal peptide peptidase SppA [Entomospira culicis]
MHRFIKFLREAVANILFILFILLAIIIGHYLFLGMRQTSKAPKLPPSFTLSLNPGYINEQSSPEPGLIQELLLGNNPSKESVHDYTRAIKLAKDDPRVTAIWLDLSGFYPSGFGVIEELHAALSLFKTSEKPIYAFSAYYGKGSYWLASLADEIWMDPFGMADINGFVSSQIFMAEALNKLGIEANIIKVGRYKNAVEGYELEARSESNQEATRSLLSSIWQHYTTSILANRANLSNNQKIAIANPTFANRTLGDSEAQTSQQLGLIDQIGSRNQALNTLFPNISFDPFDHFNSEQGAFISPKRYLNVEDRVAQRKAKRRRILHKNEPTIAIIHAEGAIVSGYGSDTQMGAQRVIEQLQDAVEDRVQAIIIRIDSGGGSSYASEQMYRVIEDIRSKKKIPVVISMGATAASGGYWMSLAADKIVAHPTTVTGSIGVFSLFFTAEGFAKKWGINEDRLFVPNNQIPSMDLFHQPSEAMLEYYQSGTNFIYNEFLERVVKAGRAENIQKADALAQGRVYSGLQALDLGLIDALGTLDDAIIITAELAELGEVYAVKTYPFNDKTMERIIQSLLNVQENPLNLILARIGLSQEMLTAQPYHVYALEPMRIE